MRLQATRHQKLGESKERLSPGVIRENTAQANPDLRLLTSRTMRQYISIILSHPVFGTLLQHLQEPNTVLFCENLCGVGVGVGVGVYSGSQCKLNSYCGLWSKAVCDTAFPNTGKLTATAIYPGHPLKTGGRQNKILWAERREVECLRDGGGRAVPEQDGLFWEERWKERHN